MEIVDANIILRYLLKDHEKFYTKSQQIIEKNEVHIPAEVVAEIVYVLEKVYKVPKIKISEALLELFTYTNISTPDTPVLIESLKIYKTENIDFVDAILVSYNWVNNHVVYTFDKKVRTLCDQR
ncbi:PIN domain-containing protein [Gracilimonas mengyeensis]|uniref:Predicted nucleic-acid-binding protein, contains PIN domain n=1 Tax=Gracilimonas mengyeensis TaxID=1302730 RepID=A0A521BAU2_9BACT|nr:PIN domain-containing protein [Gracilimonas mengyeensis]SMO44195.1 Predicted nucleic-acid-binding protein, contains PIN domain [Gracilimonas mengyeensis]